LVNGGMVEDLQGGDKTVEKVAKNVGKRSNKDKGRTMQQFTYPESESFNLGGEKTSEW